MSGQTDEYWMREALTLAEQAADHQEVPVGAIVVQDGVVIGRGSNSPIGGCDPTAHAEILAIRDACAHASNYRLPEATLYVTIEPCTMCAGAIVHARLKRVVVGALEPKAGALLSQGKFFERPYINTSIELETGVLEAECSRLITDFFAHRRAKKKALKQKTQTSE